MKKKIAYMLIGAMCTIIMSYGFVAYADQASTTGTEDNKATTASDTYVVPSKADAAALAAAAPTTTSVQPKTTTAAAPITLDQLKKLEMKIAGTNISIKIELKHEDAKTESTVEINRGKKQEKKLTGTEAIQFIQQLLAALNLQANMNKQQFVDVVFNHFEVEPAKVELKLEIKTVNQPTEIKVVYEKDDEDGDKDEDKDDDGDKAKVASLPVVKSPAADAQKQVEMTAQLTKQAEKKALIAKKKALQEAWKKAHKEQQAKKKQQKKLERGDRDDDHHDGNNQGDEDDDHDDDHGDHEGHGHEEHDDKD